MQIITSRHAKCTQYTSFIVDFCAIGVRAILKEIGIGITIKELELNEKELNEKELERNWSGLGVELVQNWN